MERWFIYINLYMLSLYPFCSNKRIVCSAAEIQPLIVLLIWESSFQSLNIVWFSSQVLPGLSHTRLVVSNRVSILILSSKRLRIKSGLIYTRSSIWCKPKPVSLIKWTVAPKSVNNRFTVWCHEG